MWQTRGVSDAKWAIDVADLDFAYPEGPPVLRRLALRLEAGARCLLVGANGSGKTTLLSLLAGKHMIPDAEVRVLGRPAFSDTTLVGEVVFLGGLFPFDVDISVEQILSRFGAVDAARAARLISLLAVDLRWRMHRVSDGQRRRVQILLSLLQPRRLLLCDEMTTDLDVVARADLLEFLQEECEARGATIFYATHIFDGIERWATHVAFLRQGKIARLTRLDELDELRGGSLLRVVDQWLRSP